MTTLRVVSDSASELLGAVGEAFLEIGADVVAELGDGGVGDEAHGDEAFLAAADHPGFGKGLDMPGHIGLGETGGSDEVGDVLFSFFERSEDSQAARFREHTEPRGDHGEGLIRDRREFLFGTGGHGGKTGLHYFHICV